MESNNEQKRTEDNFRFVEPQLIKAGSDKIMLGAINPQYPKVDCRVIWEDNYQYLMGIRESYHTLKQQNEDMKELLVQIKDKAFIGKLNDANNDIYKSINELLTKHKA